MSSDTIVAKRYAKALFEIALSRGALDSVEQELKRVVLVFEQHSDLKKFIEHPNIEFSAKLDLLAKLFENKLSDEVFNTICLMLQRKRGALLPALLEYYLKIMNHSSNRENAIVTSSVPLSESEQAKIEELFSRRSGKSIQVENKVDPALLGGIKVRIGDRLYDGSLSGKLDRLKKSLKVTQAL